MEIHDLGKPKRLIPLDCEDTSFKQSSGVRWNQQQVGCRLPASLDT